MTDPTFLTALGIRLPDLLAGFAGGVVNAFIFHKSDPWAIVGSMVVGAFTANYLGESASKMLGLSSGASAFIVGIAAMALCQGIVAAVQSWKPSLPGGKPS